MKGNTKITFALALLGGLAAPAWAASNDEVSAQELKMLGALAPNATSWSKLSDGVFLDARPGGEAMKVYAGEAGARAYLAVLRDELTRSIVAESVGGAKARANAVATSGKLATEIARLEAGQGGVGTLGKANYTRVYTTNSPQACSVFYGLDSTFTANTQSVVDTPTAVAHSYVSSVGFGPYPPGPYNVYRSVYAQVGPNAQFASTQGYFDDFSAQSVDLVFSGYCDMETRHVVDAFCGSSPVFETFFAITRTQTCAGVINNSPPGTTIEQFSGMVQ